MVSNGKGRTTCAYFLPDGRHIVYASTHAAPPECKPAWHGTSPYEFNVFTAGWK